MTDLNPCPSCGEPLDHPSGDGCANMTAHKERAMTDKELIARLRDAPADGLGTENLCLEAADRIEELEAKLAKAVEALEFYAWENQARLPSDGPWGAGSTDFGKIARATLAEIKGESHE